MFIASKINKLIDLKKYIRNLSEFFETHEKFQPHNKIKFKALNKNLFDSKISENYLADKVEPNVIPLAKLTNVLIGNIFISNKEENEIQEIGEDLMNEKWLKKNLKPGQSVKGKITKIQGNNIFVALSKNM